MNRRFRNKVRKHFRLWRNRVYQKYARYRINRSGLGTYLAQRPPDAFPPEYADLWFCYCLARKYSPAVVLEFGSGCSTLTFAYALHQNHVEGRQRGGKIYSVESSRQWADVSTNLMPEHLRPHCEILYSRVTQETFGDTQVFRHAVVPNVSANLVYLDGPPLTKDCKIAVDLLDLESQFPRGARIVIDGREDNVECLLRHFKKRYAVRRRMVFGNTYLRLLE